MTWPYRSPLFIKPIWLRMVLKQFPYHYDMEPCFQTIYFRCCTFTSMISHTDTVACDAIVEWLTTKLFGFVALLAVGSVYASCRWGFGFDLKIVEKVAMKLLCYLEKMGLRTRLVWGKQFGIAIGIEQEIKTILKCQTLIQIISFLREIQGWILMLHSHKKYGPMHSYSHVRSH